MMAMAIGAGLIADEPNTSVKSKYRSRIKYKKIIMLLCRESREKNN